ncbi:hypothetical protein RRG08_036283 [Elysia crispata]|uniref:Uncharacterized protein n=1 Tax=Elysia crispata TaxID=231223 RepID=A0AAE1DLI2_9GAST|nr:hypothetical protein RRG08_036283 [Elysia crispata]
MRGHFSLTSLNLRPYTEYTAQERLKIWDPNRERVEAAKVGNGETDMAPHNPTSPAIGLTKVHNSNIFISGLSSLTAVTRSPLINACVSRRDLRGKPYQLRVACPCHTSVDLREATAHFRMSRVALSAQAPGRGKGMRQSNQITDALVSLNIHRTGNQVTDALVSLNIHRTGNRVTDALVSLNIHRTGNRVTASLVSLNIHRTGNRVTAALVSLNIHRTGNQVTDALASLNIHRTGNQVTDALASLNIHRTGNQVTDALASLNIHRTGNQVIDALASLNIHRTGNQVIAMGLTSPALPCVTTIYRHIGWKKRAKTGYEIASPNWDQDVSPSLLLIPNISFALLTPIDHLTTALLTPIDHLTTALLTPIDHLTTAMLTPINHLTTALLTPIDHLTTALLNLGPIDHLSTALLTPIDHLTTALLTPIDHLTTALLTPFPSPFAVHSESSPMVSHLFLLPTTHVVAILIQVIASGGRKNSPVDE